MTENPGLLKGGWKPALTLVFLAPFIAEVLSGATKVSILFVLIPEMMVWGCGALLIRELVRRWGGGWASLLCLGLGLSIAEEFLIQQTSLAPLPFPGALVRYGRAWGVNWIYFLFMLGFESVFVVLVPVRVTEMLFAERRNELWLRTRGMVITSVIFLLGCRIAWYAWIKRARPIVLHAPPYDVPWVTILAGFLAIALLGVGAYAVRGIGTPGATRSTPSAWVVGLVVLVLGFPWYALMGFVFTPKQPHVGFGWVLAAGVAWGILGMLVLGHWAASARWTELHQWAAVFSATLVCMIAGYLGSSTWSRVDLIGKIVFNVIAVVGFLMLLGRVRRRAEPA